MRAPSSHEPPGDPLPVSAPPRVRDLIRSAPDGPVPVIHRGPLAVYVEVQGRCVGLVAAAAAQVPCALRTRLRDLGGIPLLPRVSAYVEGGVLHIAGTPLAVGRSVEVHAPRLAHGVILGMKTGSTCAVAIPPAPVGGLVAAAAPTGIDPDAVARLIGRGDGLTPLGDDLLCGWLALHRAAGVPTPDVDRAVRAHLGRTTLLSATLLDCALQGEVLPELGAWLSALGTPAEPGRAAALIRVGATSGAGLLAGARLALDHLLTEGALAA
jgi:hypothetical protein